MKKYFLPILLISFWGCEEDNDGDNEDSINVPLLITMVIDDVECIEIEENGSIRCDYLQLTVPLASA